MFRLLLAAIGLGLCVGCSTIREGAEKVEDRAAAVGDRIEDRATVAAGKMRAFWRRLFGGDEESQRARRQRAKEEEENAMRLKVESQPYVGAEGPQTP
jgi:hypothetical protein